ncbi:hypothetical protein CFP56_026635 [Quercus suber]|uniref:Uncharacterized protein n=1 Tax=Quercus suber TaxID=58331 RepID=A0AAW0JZ47_QUESU
MDHENTLHLANVDRNVVMLTSQEAKQFLGFHKMHIIMTKNKTSNAFFKSPPSILKDLPLPDSLFNWDSFSIAVADHFCFSLVLFQFSIYVKNLRLLLCFSVINTPFQCLLNRIFNKLNK